MKSQITNKSQLPKPQTAVALRFDYLLIRICNLFEICLLGLVICNLMLVWYFGFGACDFNEFSVPSVFSVAKNLFSLCG